MSMHNLATVFGPTLLRPAEDEATDVVQTSSQKAMIFNALQLDVHYQVKVNDLVIHYILQPAKPSATNGQMEREILAFLEMYTNIRYLLE